MMSCCCSIDYGTNYCYTIYYFRSVTTFTYQRLVGTFKTVYYPR